jgi:hypothetical protein
MIHGICFASLYRGLGTFILPSVDSDSICVDISAVHDSCSSKPDFCPCIKSDLQINSTTIKSAVAVSFDTSLNAKITALKLAIDPLSNPGQVTLLIDSLFSDNKITAPPLKKDYTASIPLKEGLYYVITSEYKFAAILIYNSYIGGFNRYHFYWVYDSNGFRELYGNANPDIVSDSAIILTNIFAGRESPVYKIRKQDNTTLVKTYISALAQKLGTDGTDVTTNNPAAGRLGIYRMSYYPPSVSSILYPSIEWYNGNVYGHFINEQSSKKILSLADKDSTFIKTLETIISDEQPMFISGRNILDATWFIDSVLQRKSTPVLNESQHTAINNSMQLVATIKKNVLTINTNVNSRLSVTLIDCRGCVLAQLFQGVVSADRVSFAIPTYLHAPGLKFIRIKSDQKEQIISVPVL